MLESFWQRFKRRFEMHSSKLAWGQAGSFIRILSRQLSHSTVSTEYVANSRSGCWPTEGICCHSAPIRDAMFAALLKRPPRLLVSLRSVEDSFIGRIFAPKLS